MRNGRQGKLVGDQYPQVLDLVGMALLVGLLAAKARWCCTAWLSSALAATPAGEAARVRSRKPPPDTPFVVGLHGRLFHAGSNPVPDSPPGFAGGAASQQQPAATDPDIRLAGNSRSAGTGLFRPTAIRLFHQHHVVGSRLPVTSPRTASRDGQSPRLRWKVRFRPARGVGIAAGKLVHFKDVATEVNLVTQLALITPGSHSARDSASASGISRSH